MTILSPTGPQNTPPAVCHGTGSSSGVQQGYGNSPLERIFAFGILPFCTDFALQCQRVSKKIRAACVTWLRSHPLNVHALPFSHGIWASNHSLGTAEYYRYIRTVSIFLGMPGSVAIAPVEFIHRLDQEFNRLKNRTPIASPSELNLVRARNTTYLLPPKSEIVETIMRYSASYHAGTPAKDQPATPIEVDLEQALQLPWFSAGSVSGLKRLSIDDDNA